MNSVIKETPVYIIKWVKKDSKGKLIEFKTEGQIILTQEKLINHIESGGLACTNVRFLTRIIVYEENGKKFLKTEGNNTLEDNLDNLPLF